MSQPFIMDFGRHVGHPITRVPVSYLKWMVNDKHPKAALAQAELDRRGTTTPEIDISGHAIDRASLRIRKEWHQDAKPEEGLHSWLARRGIEAYEKAKLAGEVGATGRQAHAGVVWVFEMDTVWPVLMSVWPDKGAKL